MTTPLIVGYFDGDNEVKCLSNFAETPFTLDGIAYKTVEGFWQGLKTQDPTLREQFRLLTGLHAKKLGQHTQHSGVFVYMERLYKAGSQDHHILLERAIRAKVAQNTNVQTALINSGQRALKHMYKNKFGAWRSGDSPALPALVFERILMTIRQELHDNTFTEHLPLPLGINQQIFNFFD